MTGGCATNFGAGPGFALGGNPTAGAANATVACMPVGTASTVGLNGDDSDGWNVNVRYTFGFGLSIGGYYEWIKWKPKYANQSGAEVGLVTEIKRDAWRLRRRVSAWCAHLRHPVRHGQELKGSVTNASFDANGTETTEWIFGYAYSLSKRSSVFAYYTQVDNDTNARSSGIVFNGIGPNAGGDRVISASASGHPF